NTVALPTDFSSSIILESLEYRHKVKCDISSFRMNDHPIAGQRLYYPLQDPMRGRCDIANYRLVKIEGAKKDIVPECKDGKWEVNSKEVDFSSVPARCEPRPNQMRLSCSGHAPPAEILCGVKCGSLKKNMFECIMKGTDMHVLDESLKWNRVDKIVCTEHGYVSMYKNEEPRRLSVDAKVQCKVREEDLISSSFFLAISQWWAVLIGFAIFALIFGGILKGCLVMFTKWEAKVQQIGPVKSHGPWGSGRTS
ncbi:hypothetical protein PMAYCL1PPCAC_30853, partial [Pristionchus mayeri]